MKHEVKFFIEHQKTVVVYDLFVVHLVGGVSVRRIMKTNPNLNYLIVWLNHLHTAKRLDSVRPLQLY